MCSFLKIVSFWRKYSSQFVIQIMLHNATYVKRVTSIRAATTKKLQFIIAYSILKAAVPSEYVLIRKGDVDDRIARHVESVSVYVWCIRLCVWMCATFKFSFFAQSPQSCVTVMKHEKYVLPDYFLCFTLQFALASNDLLIFHWRIFTRIYC